MPETSYLGIYWVQLCFKTHFKGFELQGVEISLFIFSFFLSSCTFAIYLHLSVQLSFFLHNEMCTHKGNWLLIGVVALQRQVHVVAAVMGVISTLSLTPPPPVWLSDWRVRSIVASTGLQYVVFLSYPVTPYPTWRWDRSTPELSCSHVQSTLTVTVKAAAAAESQWTYAAKSFFAIKKEEPWHKNEKTKNRSWKLSLQSQCKSALVLQFVFLLNPI